MRLFVALDLPAPLVANIEELIDRLRPTAKIQWCRPANLHLTTKFIGEWPEARLDELRQALASVRGPGPIATRVHGLGFFPNPKSPRIFWSGVTAEGLAELAAATDRATAALGIESEKRAYSPHLTLARIKERIDLQPLRDAIAALPSGEFGSFQAEGFFLYRSQMQRGGSVYTKLSEFPLSQS